MLVACEAQYAAGGVVMPIYAGGVETAFNIDEDADEDQIIEMATARLKQRVARDLCVGTGMVRLTDLRITDRG